MKLQQYRLSLKKLYAYLKKKKKKLRQKQELYYKCFKFNILKTLYRKTVLILLEALYNVVVVCHTHHIIDIKPHSTLWV